MSQHLPECAPRVSDWGEDCICKYLRASRKSVLDDARQALAALTRFDEFSWGLDDTNHGDYINLSAALQCLDALGTKP